MEGFLKKFLKIKSVLKTTRESPLGFEKSLNFIIFCIRLSPVKLMEMKISIKVLYIPLFGAAPAHAAPNKKTNISC